MYHHGDLFLNTFVYTLMFYTSLYGEKPFPVTFFHVCHSALPQPSPTSPSATFPSLPTPLSEALQVFALRDPIKVSSSRFLLTPPIWWLQRRKRERGGGRRKLCGRGGRRKWSHSSVLFFQTSLESLRAAFKNTRQCKVKHFRVETLFCLLMIYFSFFPAFSASPSSPSSSS